MRLFCVLFFNEAPPYTTLSALKVKHLVNLAFFTCNVMYAPRLLYFMDLCRQMWPTAVAVLYMICTFLIFFSNNNNGKDAPQHKYIYKVVYNTKSPMIWTNNCCIRYEQDSRTTKVTHHYLHSSFACTTYKSLDYEWLKRYVR